MLFMVLLLSQSPAPIKSNGSPSYLGAVRQALSEVGRDPGASVPLKAAAVAANAEELAGTLERSIRLGNEADREKKIEIIKAMLLSFAPMRDKTGGSYLDLSGLSLGEIQSRIDSGSIRLPSGEKLIASLGADAGGGLEIRTIGPAEEAELGRLAEGRAAERLQIPITDGSVRTRDVYPGAKRAWPIPAEVYFRECPYERILALGPSLFTAVRGFPDLLPPSAEPRKSLPAPRMKKPAVLSVMLIEPDVSSGYGKANGAEDSSAFDPDRMAQYLDDLMALPEEDQFAVFERDYLAKYDPDSPKLALLAKLFISTNLNGVFYTADEFTAAFDYLA